MYDASPLNCPCCNNPGFVISHDEKSHCVECRNCGLHTVACQSPLDARRAWNRRFDGQYGISARELEAQVVTAMRNWFAHNPAPHPPHLEHPERYPLSQVVTGCLESLFRVTATPANATTKGV